MKTLHLRIRASAGTGKTFRLTDRIIELLLFGAKPERIIALTFTQKAAGEFLTRTLHKLAKLALDPIEAEAFCNRRGIQAETSRFATLLRRVVDSLDRIEFGTLDSFFYRVLTSFGTEVGLSPSPQLLGEVSSALRERELLRDASKALSRTGLNLLEELLRGPARAKLYPLNSDLNLLEKIEALYALCPQIEAWGDPQTIWGQDGCPWESLSKTSQAIYGDIREPIASAIQELECLGGSNDKLNTIAKRLLSQSAALLKGEEVIIDYRNKKIILSSPEHDAARQAVVRCVWRSLAPKLAQARRWFVIARTMRALRDHHLATTNKLSFEDLPILLTRLTSHENHLQATDLQYRLDGWFDHWLLDEFQDTSRIQWRAIQPLLDEVLQDTSGMRSFFYVGDVKQSIYGFRHGDPALFDEIFDYYTKHEPGHIAEESLGESYRSAREIVQLIEDTFCPEAICRLGINPIVVEKWRAAWTTHSAHESNPSPGYVHKALSSPAEYWQHVANIVKETAILERPNLTCAVLVRTNDIAREAVQELMKLGISATTESNPRISADNPYGVALLMAARFVADPSDAFARLALECGPFGRPDEKFATQGLDTFYLLGAYGMITEWVRVLQIKKPNSLDSSLAASFRRAAHEFDKDYTGASPRTFAEFLAAYTEPTSARPGTVQVMTIHKAKGLEFDLVFIPIVQDTRMDQREGGEVFCSNKGHFVGDPWILSLLPENLCMADTILCAASTAVRNQTVFENLCLYYVAATRARRALVVLLPETANV